MHVLVIGGGISGLTAAYLLSREGLGVQVLEARGRPGGVIRSEAAEGYLVEHGPNSLQAKTPLLEALIEALGLAEAVVPAHPAAKKRFVVRDGRPVAVPMGPGDVFSTPLLSARAKLRLLGEPFVRRGEAEEETVAAFVRRRLGPEVVDYAVNPFVAGVYAGDPERLSMRAAFPKLYALEQAHGSLLLGGLRSMRARTQRSEPRPRRGLFSFRDGLATLPNALARALGGGLQTEATVQALTARNGRWHVTVTTGTPPAAPRTLAADAVIWAAPLYRLAALAPDLGVDLAPLRTVSYPPVSVVALGFRREDVAHPLDGFGMLVPAVETDVRILGTLFSSSLFPGRVPAGHVLLTTFVGGARRPELAALPEDALYGVVQGDLERLLGVQGTPTFQRRIYWPRAIPQYEVGYEAVQAALDAAEQAQPGLHFAGNYRSGISVGEAMNSGQAAAQRVLEAPPQPTS